jgi:hypothetical protein
LPGVKRESPSRKKFQTIKEVLMKNSLDAATGIIKDRIKRDIVTGTLNKLNEGHYNVKKKPKGSVQAAMSSTYNFSQSVLSSVYEGKGTLIDSSR